MNTDKREVPQWVADRITSVGGKNLYEQPMFRVVWGGSRFHKVGGMIPSTIYFNDNEGRQRAIVSRVAGVREVLKYHPERWHMEKWCPPAYYGSPEDWYKSTWDEESKLHTFGDYPSRGDYEHVFFLAQCPHMQEGDIEWCFHCRLSFGEYIPLEENVHVLEFHIKKLLLSLGTSAVEERFALFHREDERKRASNSKVTTIVENAMRPQIALQPTSWQPGTGGKCSVPEPKFNLSVRKPTKSLRQVSGPLQKVTEIVS